MGDIKSTGTDRQMAGKEKIQEILTDGLTHAREEVEQKRSLFVVFPSSTEPIGVICAIVANNRIGPLTHHLTNR